MGLQRARADTKCPVEHVVGERSPAVGARHAMLVEATEIIGRLLDGEPSVNFRGAHFDVEQARLWDLPARRVPIGIAVSGRDSCVPAGKPAALMIATEPKAELGAMFDAAGGAGKPRVGQVALSYDLDREAAVSACPRTVPVVRTWAQEELLPALRSLRVATPMAVFDVPSRRVRILPRPSTSQGDRMSESDTYKIIEIAGTSPDGVSEAMQSGVARAAQTLRGLDWVEVRSIRGHVEGDQIKHFQVELRVGFKLEEQ